MFRSSSIRTFNTRWPFGNMVTYVRMVNIGSDNDVTHPPWTKWPPIRRRYFHVQFLHGQWCRMTNMLVFCVSETHPNPILWNSVHPFLISQSPNWFEMLRRARQYHCLALCKNSKRFDNWNECYRRTRFHEIWVSDGYPICTARAVTCTESSFIAVNYLT